MLKPGYKSLPDWFPALRSWAHLVNESQWIHEWTQYMNGMYPKGPWAGKNLIQFEDDTEEECPSQEELFSNGK